MKSTPAARKTRRIPVAQAIRQLQKAQETAKDAICDAIVAEAKRKGLTRIEILDAGSHYFRGPDRIRSTEIDRLLNVFDTEVHRSGLLAIWTEEQGWL